VVSLIDTAPVIGKIMIGRRDVAGMGIASVIHHMAIQVVPASTARPSAERPEGRKKIRINTNSNGPRTNPTSCLLLKVFGSIIKLSQLLLKKFFDLQIMRYFTNLKVINLFLD
jgi:hypothetical protein